MEYHVTLRHQRTSAGLASSHSQAIISYAYHPHSSSLDSWASTLEFIRAYQLMELRPLPWLPTDILTLIFECIPEVPRIRILSVLSKNIRLRILRSIGRLPFEPCADATKLLPCLQHAMVPTSGVPPSAVCLEIATQGISPNISAATRFIVSFSRNGMTQTWKVFAQNKLSIQTLALHSSEYFDESKDHSLGELHFPSLTGLTISAARHLNNFDIWTAFIARHVSSLSTLTISVVQQHELSTILDVLRGSSPLRLHSLTLRGDFNDSLLGSLCNLVPLMPDLASLGLALGRRMPNYLYDLFKVAAPLLTSLEIYETLHTEDLCWQLAECTRLHTLRLMSPSQLSVLNETDTSLLREVYPDRPLSLLSKFPCLAHLKVTVTEVLATFHFPSLASVRTIEVISDYGHTDALLRAVGILRKEVGPIHRFTVWLKKDELNALSLKALFAVLHGKVDVLAIIPKSGVKIKQPELAATIKCYPWMRVSMY